jgi:CheY-like chemotaxis protein
MKSQPIYPDVDKCRALVVDANPGSRSLLTGMLREMGVGHVVQTSRVQEAQRVVENRVFDIILCDYHFDNSLMSGRDLLDELRRTNALPYSTVFVMVTGEASYAHVAEAAESALDSYLLKPHASTALAQRLIQARHRKVALKDVFEAIESDRFELAAQLCRAHFEARGDYWLYAARIGAELFIRVRKFNAARALLEAVQRSNPVPWARLGLARTEVEEGHWRSAQSKLEALVKDQPAYADALDVLGAVHAEQGDFERALEVRRQAAETTPHNVARLQQFGQLAFSCGQTDQATHALQRSARVGLGSKMFDAQNLVLLAFVAFDGADRKALRQNRERLLHVVQRQGESRRGQRFVQIVAALDALLSQATDACAKEAESIAAEIRSAAFDFEAASNLLALLERMHDRKPALADAWTTAVALRFCVSKASTDTLCSSVRGQAHMTALIRDAQADLTRLAEQAMGFSVNGAPAAAVQALIGSASDTLNGKLIDLAALLLEQHAAKLTAYPSFAGDVAELKRRCGNTDVRARLAGANGRVAGGLQIRTGRRRSAAEAHAAQLSVLAQAKPA